jgi:TatD DNase family protein
MAGAVFFDTHCHLQDDPDPVALWSRAQAAGVTGAICVGTDVEHSERGITLAAQVGGGAIRASAGLHPHEASRQGSEGVEGIAELLSRHSGIVAVGECGLDYHYDHSPRSSQRSAFAAQVALANQHRLALVVHTREAWADTWEILSAEGIPQRLVFHCFTGGPAEAATCLEMGAWLSFSGIVTFPSAQDVRRAATVCPRERLLVETDSPYLAPVPYRGKPNEPALVAVVAAAVAAAREEDLDELAVHLLDNTRRAFQLS